MNSNQLANLVTPTQVIPYNGQDITVRGLCVDDVSILIRQHKEDLDSVVNKLISDDGNGSATDLGSEIATIVAGFPKLTAQAIALATDSPDHIEVASKLPIPLQLELILAIYQLTVEEAGGIKKFLENTILFMQTARQPFEQINAQIGSIN